MWNLMYVKSTVCEVYSMWSLLYVKSTVCEVYCMWSLPYVKSTVCEVYCMRSLLYVKSAVCEVYCMWSLLYEKSTMCEVYCMWSLPCERGRRGGRGKRKELGVLDKNKNPTLRLWGKINLRAATDKLSLVGVMLPGRCMDTAYGIAMDPQWAWKLTTAGYGSFWLLHMSPSRTVWKN